VEESSRKKKEDVDPEISKDKRADERFEQKLFISREPKKSAQRRAIATGAYIANGSKKEIKGLAYVHIPFSLLPTSSRRPDGVFWPWSRTQLTTAKASLHFCSECNNLLYPKADQQRRIMVLSYRIFVPITNSKDSKVYACRICTYDEFGENKCVYRNDLLTVTKYVQLLFRCLD
jgi:hypothetical protein